jgi:hypothetical protein
MKATDRQRKGARRLRRLQIRQSMIAIRASIKASGGGKKRVGEAA